MRRNKRFSIMLLILIMLVSTLLSGASSAGIGTEKVKVIIAFHEQPGPAEEALIRAFGGSVKFTYDIVPAIAATVPLAALEGLSRNPKVARIEADVEIHALGETLPWGVDQIDAELVHKAGNTGDGIKVAVIDSGVDRSHPDLFGQVAGGYDFVNDDTLPMDDNGHGTHVAGTIAAITGNEVGVIGVAPKVSIYALKVLDASGSGNFSNIIAALQWCIDNGIQITNNSYGSSTNPGLSVETAFISAETAGILNIAAAGNEGNRKGTGDSVGYPAAYDSVVAVAATDSNNVRAYFSSTGPKVEISAPGVSINSTIPNNSYATYSGTSMASPHVAGVAALVKFANPSWTPDQIRSKMITTADPLGDPNWYGAGLVDAEEAAGTLTQPPVNTKPIVTITSPGDGARFVESTSIAFNGTATDYEDGNLSSVLVWTSSINGMLGSGASLLKALSIGTHTITASVTDSGGLTASDSITVTVEPNEVTDKTITVDSLSGKAILVSKNAWKAEVVVSTSRAEAGTVITGQWSNGTIVSATTDNSGACTFTSSNFNPKAVSSVTFTITNVAKTGYTYIPPSDTSVTIFKP